MKRLLFLIATGCGGIEVPRPAPLSPAEQLEGTWRSVGPEEAAAALDNLRRATAETAKRAEGERAAAQRAVRTLIHGVPTERVASVLAPLEYSLTFAAGTVAIDGGPPLAARVTDSKEARWQLSVGDETATATLGVDGQLTWKLGSSPIRTFQRTRSTSEEAP